MKYTKRIHSISHLIKSFLGWLEFGFISFKYLKNDLIVIAMHSTPLAFIDAFEKQILFFQKHFQIITPKMLDLYYNNQLSNSKKPFLLFTFDDGLMNNLNAVKILNSYNIKAIFFVVPDFINVAETEQKNYYIENIRPTINPAIDSQKEDFIPMTWNNLQDLINMGHTIGAHTCSHTMNNLSNGNYEKEISGCKTQIATSLSLSEENLTHFASINNTLASVGKKECRVINDNYKYHFTTLPGSNALQKNSHFIKRVNIECYWLKGAYLNAMGKLDRIRWKNQIQRYNQIIEKSIQETYTNKL